MQDRLGREINYLRISITDRCNLRCRYCMPEEGVDLKEHAEILRLEEIGRIVAVCGRIGIKKVRFTGGEPLLRRNLAELVSHIAANPFIDDLSLTTNGILFSRQAAGLKAAGLQRINMSLDTLRAERYEYITRGGKLKHALAALHTALDLGMHPVKINTVVIGGFNDDEILDFCRLACELPVHIRFIELMPVGNLEFQQQRRMVKCEEIREIIAKRYDIMPEGAIRGNGPARYFALKGGRGSLGFIAPMSSHFCRECNRLRLTSDGRLRACLYNDRETNLKEMMRCGCTDEELTQAVRDTIASKPERHAMDQMGWIRNDRNMYQIGG